MGVLIGCAFGFVLLLSWMGGHWLGRIFAFVAFFVVGAIISQLWAVANQTSPMPGQIISVAAAWVLSGLPRYWERWSANSRF